MSNSFTGCQSTEQTGVALDGTNFYVSNIFDNSMSVYDASGAYVSTVSLGNPLPNAGTDARFIEGMSADYQLTLDLPATDAPEPASLAVVGIGLMGLAATRRRGRTAG